MEQKLETKKEEVKKKSHPIWFVLKIYAWFFGILWFFIAIMFLIAYLLK